MLIRGINNVVNAVEVWVRFIDGKWLLLGSTTFDSTGRMLQVYASEREAVQALNDIWYNTLRGNPTDLREEVKLKDDA